MKTLTLCAVALLLGMASARAEIQSDVLTATNKVRQTSASGTNYFMGRVGIGTTTPERTLHVEGQIEVDALYFDNDEPALLRGTNSYCRFSGHNAGVNNAGNRVTAVGLYAGYGNSGSYVNALAPYAGRYNSGDYVNAFGYGAAEYNTEDNVNAMGSWAAYDNDGLHVNALGYNAAKGNTRDYVNVLGNGAAYNNSGDYVNAIGSSAGYANSGSHLNAMGFEAGRDNTASDLNAFGYGAGRDNTATYVNALGRYAGEQNAGTYLNALGLHAGHQNAGDYCAFVGSYAGYTNAQDYVNIVGRWTTGRSTVRERTYLGGDLELYDPPSSGSATSGNLLKFQGGAALQASGTNLYVTSGNVGIGTSSPAYKLHVNGNLNVTGTIYTNGSPLSAGGGGADNLGNHTATQNVKLNGHWLSGDGGSEGVWVDGVGNAGIGTGSPSERLHVAGAGRFDQGIVYVAALGDVSMGVYTNTP